MTDRGDAKVAGIVLAAGASERMGGPKALATYEGRTFVDRALDALEGGGCDPLIVVIAEPHGTAIALHVSGRAELTANPDPSRGQLSSLCAGLDAIGDRADAAVVALVDHPRVTGRTVAALLGAYRTGEASLVRPRFDGGHGHPYVIDGELFAALRTAGPDEGARDVFARLDEERTLTIDVLEPGVMDDIDDPASAAEIGAEPPTN